MGGGVSRNHRLSDWCSRDGCEEEEGENVSVGFSPAVNQT